MRVRSANEITYRIINAPTEEMESAIGVTFNSEAVSELSMPIETKPRLWERRRSGAVFATVRASPRAYGRAMGWAWAGRKILEINGLWAGPGWEI